MENEWKHGIKYTDVMNYVVSSGLCSGCGNCVLACTVNAMDCLEYKKETPIRRNLECVECGICFNVCSRANIPLENEGVIEGEKPVLEIGKYKALYAARTKREDIKKIAQDGGFVTTLLLSVYENGQINSALLSSVGEKPRKAEPKLASSAEEIMGAAGTRYTYSPNILPLIEELPTLSPYMPGKVAFVGVPCQIEALRKAQLYRVKPFERIKLVIGLLCSESFDYEKLMKNKIEKDMGIPLNEIAKTNIKGKFCIYLKNGEVKEIPLKETKPYARKTCEFCQDFTAEGADISAGGIGLDGWTALVVRTDLGEEIVNKLVENGEIEIKPLEEVKLSHDLLFKLSKIKRNKANKAISSLSKFPIKISKHKKSIDVVKAELIR
tara:strand:- start:591 stop:1733 length:1143 start_codon:yes stop_codon:yes gene_type:complete